MHSAALPFLVAASLVALPSCRAALSVGCSDENACAAGQRCDDGACVAALSPDALTGSRRSDDDLLADADGGDAPKDGAGDDEAAGGDEDDDAGGEGGDLDAGLGGDGDGGDADPSAGADAGDEALVDDAGADDAGGAEDEDAGPAGDAGAVDAAPACFHGAGAPPVDGLALWLSASRSATTLSQGVLCVTDASGSGNDACQTSNTAVPIKAPFLGRTAFFFDGVEDHLVVPDDATLDPAQLTVIVLGSLADGEDWGVLAMKSTSDWWTDGWGLARDEHTPRFRGFTGAWGLDHVTADVELGAPFFASFVATSAAVTLTVGDDIATGPRAEPAAATTAPLYIGASPWANRTGFHHAGAIAELFVYGRALSSSEIGAIAEAARDCYAP